MIFFEALYVFYLEHRRCGGLWADKPVKSALVILLVLLLVPMTVLGEDLTKSVTITGIGYLYIPKTGTLSDLYFSISHRLSQPVTAITFSFTYRSPNGTVLKTERYEQQFQSQLRSMKVGKPLHRDDVYQVQHSVHVRGFCDGKCGTVQIRVIEVAVDTE